MIPPLRSAPPWALLVLALLLATQAAGERVLAAPDAGNLGKQDSVANDGKKGSSPTGNPSGNSTAPADAPARASGDGTNANDSPRSDDDSVEAERRRLESARKAELASLEKLALERIRQFESLYPDLIRMKLVLPAGRMPVPLNAGLMVTYGHREREIVHEDAVVIWKDGNVAAIEFTERRAIQGGGMLRKRRWYVTPYSDGPSGGLSLHLVVDERYPSGARNLVHFPLDTGEAIRGGQPAQALPAAEAHPDLREVPVMDHSRRTSMLREVIRLSELLERRVVWTVKSRRIRDQQELDRVFMGR